MTNNINSIDVSECKHHYTNPVNGIIYHGCAIYEQINELGYSQDTLCEQNPDCYFKQLKRLQEENKSLQMLSCANCGEKYLTPDGVELYGKNVQLQKENEKLKENVEILQNQIIQEHEQYNNLTHDSIDDLKLIRKYEQEIEAYQLSENEAKEIIAELEYKNKDYLKQLDALKPENVYLHKTIKKYKQALEKIREQYVNSIFYKCDKTEEECPCHNCIILGQLDRVQNIIKIIDEVLNDRD